MCASGEDSGENVILQKFDELAHLGLYFAAIQKLYIALDKMLVLEVFFVPYFITEHVLCT